MIQVEHFTKQYRKFTAVNDVSFTVKQGEVFALLGPNGSGKTTTLKSIVGLNVPTSGMILVNGLDTQEHPKVTRELLSYLPGTHRERDQAAERKNLDAAPGGGDPGTKAAL